MNVYESHIDAGQDLPEKERERYYRALLEYLRYGIEPNYLKGAAVAVFTAVRPNLDKQRAKAKAGRASGDKRRTNAEQNANKTRTESEHNANETGTNSNSNSIGNTSVTCSIAPNGEAKRARFVPPTVDEVSAYADEKGLSLDAGHFVDHYTANGWKVGGRTSMKDWKAAVRNWCRNPLNAKAKNEEDLTDFFAGY